MEHLLKWFTDSTIGIPDTEHDLKTKTILHFFEKGRLKSTSGLNIFFFFKFTFDYSIEMDKNNLAIILNTVLQIYIITKPTITKYKNFYLSQKWCTYY